MAVLNKKKEPFCHHKAYKTLNSNHGNAIEVKSLKSVVKFIP